MGNQLTLAAWHPDGSGWRPIPDILVHPHGGAQVRESIDARREGLPALIIEVASPTTYQHDIQVTPPTGGQTAKGFEYLAWPLPEYLVFDPTEAHLRGQVRAWRTVQGRVEVWRPTARGHYRSETLGVSFRPEGFFLRVYDPEGNAMPFDHEQSSIRREAIQRAEQERQRAEREQAEREQAVRRAEQERSERLRAEQEIAALRAEIERLRGPESG